MTLQEWEDEKDRELDSNLTALFRSVDPLEPPPGFAARTVAAARRATLPAGRRALRRRWEVPLGWAALIAASFAATLAFAANQPNVAGTFARLLGSGVRTGFWLLQVMYSTSAVGGALETAGRAVAAAASTREAVAALTLMTAVAALSLLMLNRLLLSNKESSSW